MSLTKEELRVSDYKSGENYAFISYSSANEDEVFNKYVIPLQENYGMRVYFDKNFKDHATENWSDQMDDNLTRAKICIAFVSSEYIQSYACMLEILTAIINDIPILKIQINQPEPYEGIYTEKEISNSTKEAFSYIANTMDLNKDKYRQYYSEYTRIEKDISQKGKIALDKLSKHFNNCLGQIANTRINYADGLDHVVESIKNALKDKDKYNPFEEVKINEAKNNVNVPNAAVDCTQEKQKRIKMSDEAKNKIDVLACFLSKYNNDAAVLLGYNSVNKAIQGYAEAWGVKSNTISNVRDIFDPFFPESGRKGWWQLMDKISEERKALIDKFNTFNNVKEAYDFVSPRISK